MNPPLPVRDRRLIATGTAAGVLGFLLAMWAVTDLAAVPEFDTTVSQRMHATGLASPRLTQVVKAVTWLGSGWAQTGLTVLGVAAALAQRNRRLALVWVVAMAGQGLTVDLLKRCYERPRAVYADPLAVENTYSFPSGHSAGSLCGYGLLGHVLGSRRRWPVRLLVGFLAALLIAAIGLSRIYLAVHYVSDVLAGYCIGTVWLSATLWWYEAAAARDDRRANP